MKLICIIIHVINFRIKFILQYLADGCFAVGAVECERLPVMAGALQAPAL